MKRVMFAGSIIVSVLLTVATAALAQAPGGASGSSPRASQTLVCKDVVSWTVVFPCGLPENVSKPGQGSYGTGNAFGQIKYDLTSAGGNGSMHLSLHGLQAQTWFW